MRKQVRLTLRQDGPTRLTAREQQVLALVVAGRNYREIAAALVVTNHTARDYLARLYLKLGVNRRSECIVRAFQLGLAGPNHQKD